MATKPGQNDYAEVRALKGLLLAMGISFGIWAGMAELVHLML